MEVEMPEKIILGDAERSNLVWYKAQSSTINGQYVEIASAVDKIAMRDSKDPDGPILPYMRTEL